MKKVLTLSVLLLAGCGTTVDLEKHSKLSGNERNEMASKVAKAKNGEQDLNEYFSGPRELKNACIVGLRYKATVNDNTANSKSEVTQSLGGGMERTTTTSISYYFKPSPFFFQSLTDYAYDRFASELKRYGYNVIDKTVLQSAAAYTSKGEAGHVNMDKEDQYAGYYNQDPQNVRFYDRTAFGIMRLLGVNDEWSKEFYEQTKCDIYFNAEILNGMKVLGGTDLNGISAMKVSSMQSMHFTANVPWVLWEKSMKEIDSKLYGAVNHGGAGGMTPGVPLTLLYPLGENAGVSEDKLANLSNSSERQLKGAIDLMIDYNLRSFHKEVYNVKKIPDTQLATR